MGVFRRSSRKAIAPLVLALWIFALMASIAHGCGLDEVLRHSDARPPVTLGHDDQRSDDCPACDQFCADDTPLQGKLKLVEDPSNSAALLVLTWSCFAPLVNGHLHESRRPAADLPPVIAINTRYVRLAL